MQPKVLREFIAAPPREHCGLVNGGGAQQNLRVRRIGALIPYLENDPDNKRPNAATTDFDRER